MIVNVEFGYNFKPTKSQVKTINKLSLDGEPIELRDDGSLDYSSQTRTISDLDALLKITRDFKFKDEPVSVIAKLSNQIELLIAKQNNYSQEQQHNEKVNVHISNVGLLSINEVVVETQMCTDSLQEHLKEGWRIIAICPQPDQRRPDYILGRTV